MVAGIDCVLEDADWPFARADRLAIDAHWAATIARQPFLFDGRVLMQTRGRIERAGETRVFRGAYTTVAFRDFLAWRDFGYPLPGFRNGFGMAALRAADGAYVLGEMGTHTANAGRVYFPSGTPDLSDVVDGQVDLAGSIRRELVEETGLDPGTLAFAPDFVVLQDIHRVCLMREVVSPEPAAILVDRIQATLAAEERPELVRMHVVRGVGDLTPAMPPFVIAYLRRAFAKGQSG